MAHQGTIGRYFPIVPEMLPVKDSYMQYYLLLKGDSEKDSHYDSNLLGDESFGTFYSGQAFKTLTKIIETDPEALTKAPFLS